MPHIHTQPNQHDLTASAFIFDISTATPKLLLHLHKKHKKLLQPGGHVELNENPWQAIAHELQEESGYRLEQLSVLQPTGYPTSLPGEVIHPLPASINTHAFVDGSSHFHTDLGYVFVTKVPPFSVPAAGESTDLRWLTLKEIEKTDSSLIYPDTFHLAKYAVSHILPVWQAVEAQAYSL